MQHVVIYDMFPSLHRLASLAMQFCDHALCVRFNELRMPAGFG